MPEITALLVRPDSLEILLASPAAEPPPPPFAVPGGRQGTAWQLDLDGEPPGLAAGAGDLLPGLLTIGTADGGYLLADLEHLQVTAVDGPASLTAALLRSSAAELVTGQLAGWYDLILVGFPELAALGGRGSCCDTLDAALDLLAVKAVTLRRRLGESPAADVRYQRLTDPDDEDWALTLLVSSVPPTAVQLALLTDLSADPGGIAALVPGGAEPASGRRLPAAISLSAGPGGRDDVVAQIWPLGLEARPESLADADYEALTSLFVTAAETRDVSPDDPPYDGWLWPPDLDGAGPVPDPAPGAAAVDESYREDLARPADPGYAPDESYAADLDPAFPAAWADDAGWDAEPALVDDQRAAPDREADGIQPADPGDPADSGAWDLADQPGWADDAALAGLPGGPAAWLSQPAPDEAGEQHARRSAAPDLPAAPDPPAPPASRPPGAPDAAGTRPPDAPARRRAGPADRRPGHLHHQRPAGRAAPGPEPAGPGPGPERDQRAVQPAAVLPARG